MFFAIFEETKPFHTSDRSEEKVLVWKKYYRCSFLPLEDISLVLTATRDVFCQGVILSEIPDLPLLRQKQLTNQKANWIYVYFFFPVFSVLDLARFLGN